MLKYAKSKENGSKEEEKIRNLLGEHERLKKSQPAYLRMIGRAVDFGFLSYRRHFLSREPIDRPRTSHSRAFETVVAGGAAAVEAAAVAAVVVAAAVVAEADRMVFDTAERGYWD